jgi:DNA polymerase-3 subunit epsilon
VRRPASPPVTGRKRSWRRAEFAALDFEATGLDFARDRIISFGVVPIRAGQIFVGESVYEMVDPGEVAPSPESVTVHGIRPMDLIGAQSMDEAAAKLRSAIERQFLVTWFAAVEAAFLDKLFGGGQRRWRRRCVDVRKLVLWLERAEDPSWQPGTLTDVAERYEIPVASPHNALDDALVTAQLFLVAASRFASLGRPTVKHLIKESLVEPPVLLRPRAPL